MKRMMLPTLLAAIFFATGAPALAQFRPGMSPAEVQLEVATRLETQPMVEVVRAMTAAGFTVDTILAGLVAFVGQPGYGSVSLELIPEAAIVAGIPAPPVVAAVLTAAAARFGTMQYLRMEVIISSAVAADVAVNGKEASVIAIAQAAANTGKISFPEASAIASTAEVAALVKDTSAPIERVEPVIITR